MPKYNGYTQFDIEEIRALTPESAPHYQHLLYVTMNGGEAVTSLCPSHGRKPTTSVVSALSAHCATAKRGFG